MKVLILSHTREFSNFKIGSHHYANGLSERGYDVTFIGTPFTLVHRILNRKEKEGVRQVDESVKILSPKFIFPIKNKQAKIFNWINYIVCKFTLNVEFYDVVICDNPYFSPYLPLFSYDFLIYRPTDDYHHFDGEVSLAYEQNIIQKANLVIPTSDSVKKSIQQRFAFKQDSFVLENGYDASLFHNSSCTERNGSVYIGAIDKRFDFGALKILLKEYPTDAFHLYGPISNDCLTETQVLKSAFGNIRFHGPVDYSNTPRIMREARIGLLTLSAHPSNVGRSPMKLWEYAASGLPVLYSNINLDDKEYDFLYGYKSKEQLIEKYKKAREYQPSEISLGRISEHSWSRKIDIIEEYINKR
ncbi:TPA: glycosyltransferase family protein [Klebsiella pneumoniae]|uniref:glycosyltransferase family protein n=1 Tax=Klebsiella pneumoniae TaxID=573 RepID=UPI000658041A|nr:glycosyltransferase family 1 protein [Klebsiella pneumoniae]KMI20096.1 hypothetical protein SM86_02738 [Klebsiella pneumoniae]MCM5931081.1 hypothetical protein [Klebsiella pneumoniae]MDE1098359.1 hypothetical protein [Klebsiella pneumoniae]MDF1983021.1 hypothetical protein [Klebsiella pneumoniae]MDV5674289.1 hypothetical protein [Klebsiella pneumoniae]